MKTRYDMMRSGANITKEDVDAINRINSRVLGYSNERHYAFFKTLFGVPDINSVLILGVYHGRDMCYMFDVLERYHPGRKVRIIGVDKFEDAACADWPEDKKGKNWVEAGFGTPPDSEAAQRNIRALFPNLTDSDFAVVSMRDEQYLTDHSLNFDAIYLDTAHDHATVSRQLRQVRRIANPGAVVCGDDYSDEGTWGVKRAVEEAFSIHHIFADWIWFSSVEKLTPIPS